MPQIEAYVIREKPDGSKSLVYEPGHYDILDAIHIAQREARRCPGHTFCVVKSYEAYGAPKDNGSV